MENIHPHFVPMMEDMQSELVIFQEAGQPVEVRLDVRGDTVWLTQCQMSALFDTTPENVLMHLQNIFEDGELPEQATTKDFLVVQTEGKRRVQRNLNQCGIGSECLSDMLNADQSMRRIMA
jgi:hypothetical protein